MHRFNEGDLVVLRSGGPVMTISELRGDGLVVCHWFADRSLETGIFEPIQLVWVEEGSQSK